MSLITADLLDPARVQAVLAARQREAGPGDPVNVGPDAVAQSAAEIPRWLGPIERHAAVLVGLVDGAAPGVLLTRRSAHLRLHAGQVAFPGGRIDATDASPEAAALREAEEEIGLPPSAVQVLGRLPSIVTGTGYHVTPVVGLVRAQVDFRPAPDEVEAVFVLPISVLCDPAAPERKQAEFRGAWRSFWVWPHDEHYIWGATAQILVELASALTAPAESSAARAPA